MTQPSLHAVARHRVTTALRYNQPQTWRPWSTCGTYQDNPALAASTPFIKDSTKVAPVTEGFQLRQRASSGPSDAAPTEWRGRRGCACDVENRGGASDAEPWADTFFSYEFPGRESAPGYERSQIYVKASAHLPDCPGFSRIIQLGREKKITARWSLMMPSWRHPKTGKSRF